LETKVEVLILGILMLLGGFIVLLFLAHVIPTLVNFGAFAFIVGILVTFGGLVEIATDKESLQTSKKKIIAVALIVIAVGLAVPYSAWIVVVPNWSFSVTTDTSTYELGEPVHIRVTLENLGHIEHSFTSRDSNPVLILIFWNEIFRDVTVWVSAYDLIITDFAIPPYQPLERTFTWNQSNTLHHGEEWNQTYMPGTYIIKAFIPNPQFASIGHIYYGYIEYYSLFRAQTSINITST